MKGTHLSALYTNKYFARTMMSIMNGNFILDIYLTLSCVYSLLSTPRQLTFLSAQHRSQFPSRRKCLEEKTVIVAGVTNNSCIQLTFDGHLPQTENINSCSQSYNRQPALWRMTGGTVTTPPVTHIQTTLGRILNFS